MSTTAPFVSEYPNARVLVSEVVVGTPVLNERTSAPSKYTFTSPTSELYVMMYVCSCASVKMLESDASVVHTASFAICPTDAIVPAYAARQSKPCFFPRNTAKVLVPEVKDEE